MLCLRLILFHSNENPEHQTYPIETLVNSTISNFSLACPDNKCLLDEKSERQTNLLCLRSNAVCVRSYKPFGSRDLSFGVIC